MTVRPIDERSGTPTNAHSAVVRTSTSCAFGSPFRTSHASRALRLPAYVMESRTPICADERALTATQTWRLSIVTELRRCWTCQPGQITYKTPGEVSRYRGHANFRPVSVLLFIV